MGFFDLFKTTKQTSKPSPFDGARSKADIYKAALEMVAQQPPSERFVSGVVFDMILKQHEAFEECVRAGDVMKLRGLLELSYVVFLTKLQAVDVSSDKLNIKWGDTNPDTWKVDTFQFSDGMSIAQCFMPIENSTLEARLIGVVFSEHGDGFYYCMLNKDENAASEVKRNRALFGSKVAGEVKGRGLDLMVAFRDCIRNDYNSDCAVDYIKESQKMYQETMPKSSHL